MHFSTQVPTALSNNPIDYNSRIFLLGSCFAQHMAQKFERYRFISHVNPFGILFQPTAIEAFIGHCLLQKKFSQDDVFEQHGIWHHYDAHSALDGFSANEVCDSLNIAARAGEAQLTSATHIIITLGTAWVYRHKASGNYVANCHKVPQREFDKELLSVERIGESLDKILLMIAKINRTAQVIFTVSPVRHLRDGFVQNQRSKSNLIAALHPTIEKHPNTHYFPAFEIVMDELRDYRFYAPDMIHPNSVAIDYIWERFGQAFIAEDARSTAAEVEAVVRGLEHRPFNPDTVQHRNFMASLAQKIAALQSRFAHMKF